MGSTRLPGKVMMELCGKPMLQHIIERVQRTKGLERVAVATTYLSEDKPIKHLCRAAGADCYGGAVSDVMFRFLVTAAMFPGVSNIVRITADCPFVDPKIIARVMRNHEMLDVDYTSNVMEPGFPDGFDVECFRLAALKKAFGIAPVTHHREHVTSLFRDSKLFTCLSLRASKRMKQFQNVKLSVDTPEDFERAKTIYEKLYPAKPDFDAYDVLNVLEKGI